MVKLQANGSFSTQQRRSAVSVFQHSLNLRARFTGSAPGTDPEHLSAGSEKFLSL